MDSLQELRTTLDFVWVLVAAALVFIMQAGFLCVESGMARAKNSINVAIKNMADFLVAAGGFWILGFGLMFGLSHDGWFGTSDFATGLESPWAAAFFVFQAVFCGTAATIDGGAIAERTRFGIYLVISFMTSCLIYPVFGHWAWGSLLHGEVPGVVTQGWLEARGFHDFAGSTVVHSAGAWVGLAGMYVIGPRLGRFDEDGTPQKLRPSNLPLVYLGVFILFFGWFGFNAGSTLSATTDIAGIAAKTLVSAVFGGLSGGAISWLLNESRRPEPEFVANGVLGGLVGITAGCDAVSPGGAAIIGLVAGLIVYGGTLLLERVLKVDDVVGAIPVHGFSGAWGTMAVAIFQTELPAGMTRLQYLGVQATGVVSCFLWAFGTAYIVLALINRFFQLRVSPDEEKVGLNVAEHGAGSGFLDLVQAMQRVAHAEQIGDEHKVEVERGTEVGDLGACFNGMIDALGSARLATRQQHEQTQAALEAAEEHRVQAETQARAVKDASAALEQRRAAAEAQAERYHEYLGFMQSTVGQIVNETAQMEKELQNTAARADRMAATVARVTERMQAVQQSLDSTSTQTQDASNMAQRALDASRASQETVEGLGDSTVEIDKVMQVIDSIALETRMVALNASIEAARLGEQGDGFAVVAANIRQLSTQSEGHASDIRSHADRMQAGIAGTLSAIKSIDDVIDGLNGISSAIAATMDERSRDVADVGKLALEAHAASVAMNETVVDVSGTVGAVSGRVKEIYDEFRRLLQAADAVAPSHAPTREMMN